MEITKPIQALLIDGEKMERVFVEITVNGGKGVLFKLPNGTIYHFVHSQLLALFMTADENSLIQMVREAVRDELIREMGKTVKL